MNSPARFKSAHNLGLEGRLLAAGFQQQPGLDSLKRAAARLGLPAGLLAASTATAVASATAAGTGNVTAFAGLGLVGATKAALIGISIGVGIAVSSAALRVSHEPSPVTARPSSPRAAAKVITPRASATTSAAVSEAEPAAAMMETSTPVQRLASGRQANTPDLVAATPSSAPSGAPVAGRFNDVEPQSALRDVPLAPPAPSIAPALQPTNAAASGPTVVDPKLAREVASLDRARRLTLQGAPAAALGELDTFSRQSGYSSLSLEAQFVRIDALVALGRRAEAARLANALPWESLSNSQRQRLQVMVRNPDQ